MPRPLRIALAAATFALATAAGTSASPAPATREPHLWPFAATSLWNTSLGREAELGSTAHPLSVALRSRVGQLNAATFTTPVNIAAPDDPPLTIHEVEMGRWSPPVRTIVVPRAPADLLLAGDMLQSKTVYHPGGRIAFSNVPDGFLAIIDRRAGTAIEAYKACWTADGPSSRTLIARKNTVRTFDLRGDGVEPRGARASGLSFLGGLIRRHELERAATDPRNAIPHALALAIHNAQLLNPKADSAYPTPGYQWPARSFDNDGPANYSGAIRMGTHFVLHPDFDIERPGLLSPEGKALAYALRDYGAYVVDRSTYVSLYAEQGVDALAASRLKADWQTKLLPHTVPVLNNSAATVGGPGPRVRPPAPPFAAP